MKKGTFHTSVYRLLSLLIVLTMLSGHLVPLSFATDGAVAGEGLLSSEEPLPAPVNEDGSGTLLCQLPEHSHIDGVCWQYSPICGMKTGDYHTHDAVCLQEVTTLTCTIPEQLPHAHTEMCYGPVERLICTLEEVAAHTHGEGCYTLKNIAICGQAEAEAHIHTDLCKSTEKILICTQSTEAGHTHSDACKGEPQLICQLAADESHTHGPACYAAAENICGLEETPAHIHGEECYTVKEGNACGLEETAGHTHTPECYQPQQELTCQLAETAGHIHGEGCKITETGLICQQAVTEGHSHSESCYSTHINCNLPTDVPHQHSDACYSGEKTLICLLEEHIHGEECYQGTQPADDVLTDRVLEALWRYVTVSGSLPEDVVLTAEVYDVEDYAHLKAQVLDYLRDGEQVAFGYDISLVRVVDGVEESYQPEEAVTVTVRIPETVLTQLGYDDVEELAEHLNLYHVHEDTVEPLCFEADDSTGTLCFEVDQFSAFIGTIQSGTSVYFVQQLGYTLYQGETVLSAKKMQWQEGVTITVKPDLGYQLTDVVVVDKENGDESPCASVTKNDDGSFTISYVSASSGDLLIDVTATEMDTGSYVYLDLSAGIITIKGNSYSGYRYDGGKEAIPYQGTLGTNQSYYIYQSDGDSNTGLINGTIVLPEHKRVTYLGQSWGEYITNNTEVNDVIGAWNTATEGKRTATNNYIDISGKVEAVMIIDSLWSSNHEKGASFVSGGIRFIPGGSVTGASLTLYLKGDNRFGSVFYNSNAPAGSNADASADNHLIFDGDTDATLTAANLQPNASTNYWRSAIGGNDGGNDHAKGIVINGGIIYAGTTEGDDCTAIGGGGNAFGLITINGGTVTAVTSSSGAAIGGGIGKTSYGGQAVVTINGGEVYAYNFSCKSGYSLQGVKYIPAAAIGGGSSARQTCNPCYVTITGGTVYAQSVGGTAIGGGSSADNHGGNATVTISGGTVYAKSIEGMIDGTEVPAGAAIGGGTGGKLGNGGNAIITISGDAKVYTGSMGGGDTIGNKQTYKIGHAEFYVSGGEIQGQGIMASGAALHCKLEMSGGLWTQNTDTDYQYLEPDGGAVWMDDPNGVAQVSGGTISGCSAEKGGAVYMTAGSFTLAGDALITDCEADNGGAIYMGGGIMEINGGTIQYNRAVQNGGAVYMGGGELNIAGGTLKNNTAGKNGGGAYVRNGNIYMSDGTVSGNTASSGAGGGMYVSAENTNVEVKIFSGTVSGNIAATGGGAVAVYGAEDADESITVQTGVEDLHAYDENGQLIPFNHGKTLGVEEAQKTYTHSTCPVIENNTAGEKGGAIHIMGSDETHLNIYCLTETGNQSDDDALSHFLMVDGGRVIISSAVQENNDEDFTNEVLDKTQGKVMVSGSVHVSGGKVDLYGGMTNPIFKSTISVDITDKDDYFRDHRNTGIGDEAYYKLLYFENFLDPETKIYYGRYMAYQIKHGEGHCILPVMYSHPGYEIVGWNTSRSIDENEEGSSKGWYYVDLEKENPIVFDNNPVGDLTLYAIWEANTYKIIYEDNIPIGETFEGNMDDQDMRFDVEAALNPNEYVRYGYRFANWNTDPHGDGTPYSDGAVVKNLTKTPGAKIYLYAQWEACDHDPRVCDFTYSTKPFDTLVRTCECRGQTVSFSLSVDDDEPTYTWENNGAVAFPAQLSGPVVIEGELHQIDDWTPTIYYAQQNDGDWSLLSSAPSQAGNYAAVIVDNESEPGNYTAAAYLPYVIQKADQPLPAVTGVTVDEEEDTLTVNPVAPSPKCSEDGENSPIKTQYKLYYYDGDTPVADENPENEDAINTGKFKLKTGYTNYYVEVWYSEGHNHNPSGSVKSYPVFYQGDTEIRFEVAEGIEYIPKKEKTEGSFSVEVSAKDGWYLLESFSVTSEYGGDKFKIVANPKYKKYSISGVPSVENLTITIKISGADQIAGITAAVAEKRQYGDVKKTEILVSRDSAFTASYSIFGYNASIYQDLSLQFAYLPKDATILMMDKTDEERVTYWHYTAEGTEETVPLTQFRRMGTENERFTDIARRNMTYQFLVDYSWTAEGSAHNPEMQLVATIRGGNPAGLIPELSSLYEAPEVTLADAETFALERVTTTTASPMSQTVKLHYSDSDGAASRWEDRADTLVLTYVGEEPLPEDLILQSRAYLDGQDRYVANQWMLTNSDGKQCFFIPLYDLDLSNLYALTLRSNQFPVKAVSYLFDIEWVYSRSGRSESPLGGDVVAELTETNGNGVPVKTSLEFRKEKDFVPAAKPYTQNDQHLFTPGSSFTLLVDTVVEREFIDSVSFKVELMFQTDSEDGEYAKTGWNKYLPKPDVDKDTNSVTIPLSADLGVGNFCVMTSVIYGNETVLKVPYYVIIKASEEETTMPDDGSADAGTEAGSDTGADTGTN